VTEEGTNPPSTASLKWSSVSGTVAWAMISGLTQRLHLDLEAWVRRADHLVALGPVVLRPAVPTSGGHPKPVDQHDRRALVVCSVMVLVLMGAAAIIRSLGQRS
jgi:hypothetical protein